MFCVKCGKELPDYAVFCSICGAKIGHTEDISITSTGNSVAEPTEGRFIKCKYTTFAFIAVIIATVCSITAIGWSGFIILTLMACAFLFFLWFKQLLTKKLYLSIAFSIYVARYILIDISNLLRGSASYAWYANTWRVLLYILVVIYWLYTLEIIGKKIGNRILLCLLAVLILIEILVSITHLSYGFRSVMTYFSNISFLVAFVFLELFNLKSS